MSMFACLHVLTAASHVEDEDDDEQAPPPMPNGQRPS